MSRTQSTSTLSTAATAEMSGSPIRFRDFHRLCDAVAKESGRLAKSAKIREWVSECACEWVHRMDLAVRVTVAA